MNEMTFPPIPLRDEKKLAEVAPIVACGEELVDITVQHPRITYLASYHRQGMAGGLTRCWVREGVARRLWQAADLLPVGYGLAIFDTLRPLSVQRAIYRQFATRFQREDPAITPEELGEKLDTFVAKPVKNLDRPAPHTTGGAVDLTLTYNGVVLDLGTPFDETSPLAFTDALERIDQRDDAQKNRRRILYGVMTAAGFANYECEWWHYAYGERLWAAQTGQAPMYGFCPQCDD